MCVWVMVRVRVMVVVRIRVRVRAEMGNRRVTEYPMAAYVRVYFKLQYTQYILSGIF